jgi:uncharacterized phage protein gp47/JayE
LPWSTPTLRQVRTMVRDDVVAALSGATQIGNSVLRVMADAKAGLAHLVLRYIDWLSRQMLPDTAEVEWLDRHGNIWLVNSDGTKGRKSATLAIGSVTMTGTAGTLIPIGTVLSGIDVEYETLANATIGSGSVQVSIRALDAGAVGNREEGEALDLKSSIAGVNSEAIIVTLDGGVDEESDDLLRERVLLRIQNPPMGGDLADYVQWALGIPGVTRAWAASEMGPGTITVRFMMDVLRAASNGIPNSEDVEVVRQEIDRKRPVTVMDAFVFAPIPYNYNITISGLELDSSLVRGKIEAAIKDMEYRRSRPGQTMYRSWIDEAISGAVGEDHHELTFTTTVMPNAGSMPMIGTITYA